MLYTDVHRAVAFGLEPITYAETLQHLQTSDLLPIYQVRFCFIMHSSARLAVYIFTLCQISYCHMFVIDLMTGILPKQQTVLSDDVQSRHEVHIMIFTADILHTCTMYIQGLQCM